MFHYHFFYGLSINKLLNDHLFGKELFVRFTASSLRKLPSVYVLSYFPFGFEGRMWELIVSVPDRCLSFYFVSCTSAYPVLTPFNPSARLKDKTFLLHFQQKIRFSQLCCNERKSIMEKYCTYLPNQNIQGKGTASKRF